MFLTTKRPWTVHEDTVGSNPDICINAAGYGIIAHIGGGHLDVRRANARLIVHAVNCHDDLLAACKQALGLLTSGRTETLAIVRRIEAAIARCEEEPHA